ncbi:unnamed protein product [Vicia faba]|uniref:RING-type domain-containing protein n=1 Tax=Vicia faba TaxID=3906 RepID=A0AAV1A9N4_VICFA|nr:unnamed protein product [Vicia faba]
MERPHESHHIIEIAGSVEPSASTSSSSRVDESHREERISGARLPVGQPSVSTSGVSNSRSSSLVRRGEARRSRSPVHSGLWISIELVLLVSQIVASVVVLSLSRNEHPRTPLFQWIVGYASGCVATLPLLYWRYYNHNHMREQESAQTRQTSPRVSDPSGTFLSIARSNGGDDGQAAAASARSNQTSLLMNRRMKILVEYFKISLDCFFAVWFVVGNVWIFGGRSSVDEAPNLYREDLSQNRGATSESINALPVYKFKMKKHKRSGENSGNVEGGVVAAGTAKERVISGEDAVCCICLAKYENNDELRELPCSHLFHKDCVDKWLKINALCPLCKSEVGEDPTGLGSGEDATQTTG